MRGNLSKATLRNIALGSIPARAGEPLLVVMSFFSSGVYPRACGGTNQFYAPVYKDWGLSPRVRGNLRQMSFDRQG